MITGKLGKHFNQDSVYEKSKISNYSCQLTRILDKNLQSCLTVVIMSLSIILDKSTFQSLSYDELILVHNYYKPNITPVLVLEVLGDLAKEAKEGRPAPKERVIDFARKLFPYNSVVNHYYRDLLISSLLGDDLPFDERPILKTSKTLVSSTGAKGHLFEDTPEEISIKRWKDGNFDETDKFLSSLWRQTTTNKEVIENLKSSLKNEAANQDRLKNLDEVNRKVESLLSNPDLQVGFLKSLIENYRITPENAQEIFLRWEMDGKPNIETFSSYAYFCLKVDLFFFVGLQHNLIGTRPTNRVDLEYLYYLPFCSVFSSNDKFHKRIVGYFLNSRQRFISGQELKDDLKQIVDYRKSAEPDVQKNTLKKPPIIEGSPTFKFWQEFYDYPNNITEDDKDFEYYKSKMDEFLNANETEDDFDSGNPDFIVKQTWMKITDPCPCGSGKMMKDCCLPKDHPANTSV